jgi:hypothetical protein
MLQRHTDDKGSIKTREGILGFTRDSLTGAVVDSDVNVAMRASKLLRGLTNGATQEEDFKWANGHLYICNCTIEICTLSELHILVSSRSKPFETAKQLPKVEMNFSATKGRERKMPSHAKRETQRCPRCT